MDRRRLGDERNAPSLQGKASEARAASQPDPAVAGKATLPQSRIARADLIGYSSTNFSNTTSVALPLAVAGVLLSHPPLLHSPLGAWPEDPRRFGATGHFVCSRHKFAAMLRRAVNMSASDSVLVPGGSSR